MYRGSIVAVVMPAFNVEAHIAAAIGSIPEFVDQLIVVDDGSSDGTAAAIEACRRSGLLLLRHPRNCGVGAAIATGYDAARRCGAQLIAVMAGDGQMDPADLPRLLDPLVEGRSDYAKGNRFAHPDVWRVMPRLRLVGNIALSWLTRRTSGYSALFDSQCGYTAVARRTLDALAVERPIFARYGYLNDLLARLNVLGARVVDVPVRPIYDGQPSGIRLWTVIYPILFVLLCSLARRMWQQRVRGLLAARSHGPRALADEHPDLLSAPRR